ncbi:MAG: N-acetylmuramoyl-L-alanine amidase [Candidatus Omnitrophica bacterium]|nr:N-acetylmuramoyl-L-alanine amidase [Candidatus Omnitrophota bacterium]
MKFKKFLFLLIVFPIYICFSSVLSSQQLVNHHIYIVNNHKYISFKTISSILYIQNFAKIENRIYFQYHGVFIKTATGSSTLIAGGQTYNLTYPIEEVSGKILFPLKSIDKVLSSIKENHKSSPAPSENPISVNSTSPTNISISGNTTPYVILIDPGHGGIDTGAIGPTGLEEKNVNLDIALRMRNFLIKKLKNYPNVKLYMTRDKDESVSLEQRVEDAIDVHANMFFCIHTNSSIIDRWYINGFETFYPRYKQDPTFIPGDNKTLNKILNSSSVIKNSILLSQIVQKEMEDRLNTPDLGVKHAEFYVLRYTPCVSILTEVGFICNPNIEANLRNPQVREAIAHALGSSILEYLKLKKII